MNKTTTEKMFKNVLKDQPKPPDQDHCVHYRRHTLQGPRRAMGENRQTWGTIPTRKDVTRNRG